MTYRILVERYAQKQIMKFDKRAISILKTAIFNLSINPRPFGYKKLKGEDAYRIRVGSYRVIYEINDDIITVIVVSVGHRKNIYK